VNPKRSVLSYKTSQNSVKKLFLHESLQTMYMHACTDENVFRLIDTTQGHLDTTSNLDVLAPHNIGTHASHACQ